MITAAEKSRRAELRRTLTRGSYITCDASDPVMMKTSQGWLRMEPLESEAERKERERKRFEDKYCREW